MILLGAALALAYIPGWTGSHVQTGWAVLSLVLPWTMWRGGPPSPLHLFGLAFLWFGAASLFWTPTFLDGAETLWHLVIFGLAFYWAPDPRRLLIGLAIGLSVSSALAIGQQLGFRPVLQITVARQSGLFFNPLVLGAASAMVIVGLMTERLWWWTLPLLPGFVLAGSRGAWLAAIVASTAMVAGRLRWLVPPVVLAGAACLFFTFGDPNGALRLSFWHATIEGLSPLGHGVGSFTSLIILTPGGLERPGFAHNQFLTLLYEFGAAAAVPILIAALALWRSDAKEWPIFVCGLVIALLFDPLAQPLLGFLFVVAAGRCVSAPALVRHGLAAGGRPCHVEA